MGRIDMDEMHDPFEDQVECARYRAERDALAQRMEEIASEIDRTLLGVEGIEDAPAMRWARGLREALGALHSPRTSYEDIEAARWVREHGGIEGLRRMFRDADSRRIELCGALGIDLDTGWSDAMAELDRRLMPEGMEWPRYEDGVAVRIGWDAMIAGRACAVTGVNFSDHCWTVAGGGGHEKIGYGERAIRPEPRSSRKGAI